MKKLLLFVLLALTNKSDAMDMSIVLPSQKELNDRLHALHLDHFAEKSGIGKELGGQTKRPLVIVMDINLALRDYCKNLNNPVIDAQMEDYRPMIIEKFLKDHPQAIEFLKSKNILP